MKKLSTFGSMLALLSILLLGACSDGTSGAAAPASTTLSGTAASGAPLAGATVTVTGANGVNVTVMTDAGGSYTATGTFTYPAIVTAISAGVSPVTYYSWATAAGTANVTPLTTAALSVNVALPNNLNDVAAAWAASYAAMTTQADMRVAQAIINANLATQINTAGLTATSYDFLTTAFTADSTGIDLMLDGLRFNFDFAAGTFGITLADTTAVVFDPNISTAGFTIGGGTGGGTIGGGADIDVTNATPASGNTNISGVGAVVTTTFDTLNTVPVTRVTVAATTADNIKRQVLVYFATATGVVQAVSYSWGTANVSENIVYCPSAGCTGVTVNQQTKEIFFSNTALDNNSPVAQTDKFATLSLGGIQYP